MSKCPRCKVEKLDREARRGACEHCWLNMTDAERSRLRVSASEIAATVNKARAAADERRKAART